MAKQTPPKEEFINRINLDEFKVTDSYMLIKSAMFPEKNIYMVRADDEDMVGNFPKLVLQVGPDIADMHVGMEVYTIPGAEGIKVYEEVVRGRVPKLGVTNATLMVGGKIDTTNPAVEWEDGIVGRHHYWIMERSLVFGFRDLREVKPELEETVG